MCVCVCVCVCVCYHIMNIHDQFVVINTTQLSLSICLPALYVLSIFCIIIEASLVLYKINGTLIGAGAHKHREAIRYGDGASYYCFYVS